MNTKHQPFVICWFIILITVTKANPIGQSQVEQLSVTEHMELPQRWEPRELSQETLKSAVKIILPFSISSIEHDETLPVYCEDRTVTKKIAFSNLELDTNLIALPVDALPDLVIICRMAHDDLIRFDHSIHGKLYLFLLWITAVLFMFALAMFAKFACDWYFYDEFDHAHGF